MRIDGACHRGNVAYEAEVDRSKNKFRPRQ
jgi:hypothetical protein